MSWLIIFELKAFEQYQEWIETNKKIALKISSLILEIAKNPFKGRGKPELLKGILKDIGAEELTISIE